MFHNLPKLLALTMILATAFLGAACMGREDQAAPPTENSSDSEYVGEISEALDDDGCPPKFYCCSVPNVDNKCYACNVITPTGHCAEPHADVCNRNGGSPATC